VLAALQGKADILEQLAVADRHAERFCLDDGSPTARRLQELEAEALALAREQVDLAGRLRALPLEPLDLTHLHLRLTGHLLGGRTEAGDEPLEALDVRTDPAGRLGRSAQARGLLAPPVVPRPGEVGRAAGVEFEHGVRHRLEEPAVVRHDDDPGVE
jgi:hypothetical protein